MINTAHRKIFVIKNHSRLGCIRTTRSTLHTCKDDYEQQNKIHLVLLRGREIGTHINHIHWNENKLKCKFIMWPPQIFLHTFQKSWKGTDRNICVLMPTGASVTINKGKTPWDSVRGRMTVQGMDQQQVLKTSIWYRWTWWTHIIWLQKDRCCVTCYMDAELLTLVEGFGVMLLVS